MDLNSILNIRSVDYKDEIYEIVPDEMNNLNAQVDDVSGFCKYIANNIEVRLKELGIKTYNIDLNDIGVDHVFLIGEYRNKKMMRFLIDPTFEQFTRRDNKLLVRMDSWPSDKINKDTLNSLLEYGLVEIDEDILNDYLFSFGSDEVIDNLDSYLLNLRMDKIQRRR